MEAPKTAQIILKHPKTLHLQPFSHQQHPLIPDQLAWEALKRPASAVRFRPWPPHLTLPVSNIYNHSCGSPRCVKEALWSPFGVQTRFDLRNLDSLLPPVAPVDVVALVESQGTAF